MALARLFRDYVSTKTVIVYRIQLIDFLSYSLNYRFRSSTSVHWNRHILYSVDAYFIHGCGMGLDDSVYCHFQKYFSYIVTDSFIGEGNRSTWRKPPTCRKALTILSHNVWRQALIAQVVVQLPCDHTITTTAPQDGGNGICLLFLQTMICFLQIQIHPRGYRVCILLSDQ